MSTLLRAPVAPPRASRDPSLADVAQVRLCLAAFLVVVAVTACHVLHTSPTVATVVAGVVVAVGTPRLAVRHQMAVAGVGWAWVTGFVVHTGGLLTFTGHDAVRAGVLAAIAVTVTVASLPTSDR